MKSLIMLVCMVPLMAQTLPQLIDTALQRATSLQVIQKRLEAVQKASQAADAFANPVLGITTNTLSSDQKMSQSQLSLRQKIYFYGKRDAKKELALTQVELERAKLQEAKAELVYEIKKEVYRIWELKELLRITQEYIELTNESKELYESYTASDTTGSNHMGIMSAELSLSELEVKQTRLGALLDAAYARVEYLVTQEVHSVEISLEISALPVLGSGRELLGENLSYRVAKEQTERQQRAIRLARLQNYPDFDLYASYAYRERFEDYMNFGLFVSLPIYGTEDVLLEEAKIRGLQSEANEAEVSNKVTKEAKELYSLLRAQYEIYHIIHDRTLPQVEHMLELSSSMIQNGMSLFEYIDILERKLKLEEQAIDATAKFFTIKAKLEALKGALK